MVKSNCGCPLSGKGSKFPDSHFDKKELMMGIDHEMEHTHDRETAKNIAKDHLCEIPSYYSLLNQMENTYMKSQKKKKY